MSHPEIFYEQKMHKRYERTNGRPQGANSLERDVPLRAPAVSILPRIVCIAYEKFGMTHAS